MKEIEQFEKGQMGWNDLPDQARRFYLDNYPHESIIVGEDENGPVSVADAQYHGLGSWIFGGGKDNQGYLGRFGDYLGQFGDWVGATDYAGKARVRDETAARNAKTKKIFDDYESYVKEGKGKGYYEGQTLADDSADTLAADESYRKAGDATEQDNDTQRDILNKIASGQDQYTNDLATRAGAEAKFGGYAHGVYNSDANQIAGTKAVADSLLGHRLEALNSLRELDLGKAGDLKSLVGSRLDKKEQSQINENIKKYNYEQQAPYRDFVDQLQRDQYYNQFNPIEPAKQGFFSKAASYVPAAVDYGLKFASLLNDGGEVKHNTSLMGKNYGGNVHTKPSLMKRRF